MNPKIRSAKKSDKNNFVEVQKEAFPNLSSEKQKKYFDLKLKNREIFVMESEGRYAGHITFSVYTLIPPFSGSIFLEELAIKKDFRGRGFGKLLINSSFDYCKKNRISLVYLGTGDYSGNKSVKLYKKLGFKKVGKLDEINPKSEYKYGQIFYGRIV